MARRLARQERRGRGCTRYDLADALGMNEFFVSVWRRTPFYARLVPGGLARVPGLQEVLTAGARVVDTACGAGQGVLRLATAYPSCTVIGVGGDAHSITQGAVCRGAGWSVLSR